MERRMKKIKKWSESLIETAKTVGWAIVIAIIFRSFLFEPFSIPSGSMIPTLKVGDYLFVSKYAYGYSRYSFPLGVIPIPGRIIASSPERGDVIVFRKPGQERVDYIKRLVGLPGDKIYVRGGILHINDQPVIRKIAPEIERDLTSRPAHIYTETFSEGHTHLIQEYSDSDRMDNTPPRIVPEGHYFFMGDNRDSSLDSRAGVGFVPFENLVGRAEFIFFSYSGESRFFQIWKWPSAIRFGRIGKAID